MNLSSLIDNAVKIVKANAPEILTALGVVGVATTAAMSARAGYQTADAFAHSPSTPVKERMKQSWTLYIPPALAGATTIACIVCASKGHTSRTAAAVTAYTVTERAFSEYRQKVVEEIGKRKDERVLEAVAQDRVLANPPPPAGQIVVVGRDQSLFMEQYTGRYFRSDMDTLQRAQNQVNYLMLHNRYVTLTDFYAEVGLPPTNVSDKLGWTDAKGLMNLEFVAVKTEDESQACLAFGYTYLDPLD